MSLFESIETPVGAPFIGSISPSVRRAALLEHPTLAVAAIQKGRIRETNAAWKSLFVLPPDVSVESHVATLFPNVTSADRFERSLQADVHAADRANSAARAEHMLVRRDGTAFLAEIVVWLFGVEDVEHLLGGDAIWQVRDITVERTLRRELRDLEDYHREVSRHQWDMTFVIDRKGRISYASSSIESALGYRVRSMLGEPFSSLLDPAHAGEAEQWLRAATRHQSDGPVSAGDGFPLRVLHGDGGIRTLACRPRDCFGIPRIAGMVIHARDVTDALRESEALDLARAEATSLRAALIELARVAPSPTLDARINGLLVAIRERVDASVVMYWHASGDGAGREWIPYSASCGDTSEAGANPAPPPLQSDGSHSAVDGPLVIADVHDAAAWPPERIASLQASSTAALIEVPVLDEGRTLGWLAVASSVARSWPDAQLDFIVGCALLVALAIKGGRASKTADGAIDGLTGLPGRLEAERYLSARVASAVPGDSLVAIVVDVDRLQDINDGQGLQAGDAAIARTAAVVGELVGPDGFVARIGSDEFLAVVERADARQVDALVDGVLSRLGESGDSSVRGPVEVSVGVARLAFDGSDATVLLQEADLAMREAKSRGGGQSFVFNARLGATLRMKRELDAEIEDAIARNEFTIFYQPQIALAHGTVVGLEALLRWQHPTRGLLLPDVFIGSAFNRGLIDIITKLVLMQVCERIAAWRRVDAFPEFPVAVNVTGRQLNDRRLPALVASALLKSGLPARLLVLEITEQSLIGDEAGIDRVVKELSRLGVRIAISGFTVGHRSLRFLRQLNVSQIKLDSRLVNGLPGDADCSTFVAAFVDLAHRLKYQVVAEGVETQGQFAHLREIGCAVAQGFHLGAPMSAGEIQSYVEANKQNPFR